MLQPEEVMLLHVRIGNLEVPLWFRVVSEITVDLLLATSFVSVSENRHESQITSARFSVALYPLEYF